ncbi:MAG: hypothetical protein GY796_29670 [Chloroflexi bacterium]|nr:hypothetical protein [Chloroflexota bacterium]
MSNYNKHVLWALVLTMTVLMLAGCNAVTEVAPTTAAAIPTTPTNELSPTETAVSVPTDPPATPTNELLPTETAVSMPTQTPPPTEEPATKEPDIVTAKPQLLEFYTEW